MHFGLDRGGTMLSVNGQGTKQLGYESRELLGHPLAMVVHRDDRDLAADNLAAAARAPGRVAEMELRKVRKDGSILWVHQQVRSSGGAAAGPPLLAVCTNITAQKRVEQELLEHQERLRALTHELSLADERARRRLSLNVHDHIGQALAGARLKLEGLISVVSDAGHACDLRQARGLIDQAIQATRSLTFELSSPVLYELGLEAALQSVGTQTMVEHGVAFTFDSVGTPRRLARDSEIVLYRTVRELLHNVVKHAQASRFSITLNYGEREALVVVADDGKGFDAEDAGNRFGPNGGFGLFSIREHLRQIGGRLRIVTAPRQGTSIEVSVAW